jgi:hypothetical protein
MYGFYTRFFGSQVENTLGFRLILSNVFGRFVENFRVWLWKSLWKTGEVI